MPALFIAGTGTDIGKTYVTAALLRALKASGRAVDALKPVVSGFDEAAPLGSDPAVLLEALGIAWSHEALDRIAPLRFRAPLAPPMAAALEGRSLSGQEVVDLCQARIAAAEDALLLIESAGGIMSPLAGTLTMLDLAVAVGAPAILVAGSYLGTISHTLTAHLALRGAGVAVSAVVVSESPDPNPPLQATVQELARHLPPASLVTIARGSAWPPGALDFVQAAAPSAAGFAGSGLATK